MYMIYFKQKSSKVEYMQCINKTLSEFKVHSSGNRKAVNQGPISPVLELTVSSHFAYVTYSDYFGFVSCQCVCAVLPVPHTGKPAGDTSLN